MCHCSASLKCSHDVPLQVSDVPHVPFVPRFNYMHRGEVPFIFPTSSNVKENDVIGRVDLGFGTFSRVCV